MRGRGRKPDAYKVFEHNKPEELAIAILRAVLKEVLRKNDDDKDGDNCGRDACGNSYDLDELARLKDQPSRQAEE